MVNPSDTQGQPGQQGQRQSQFSSGFSEQQRRELNDTVAQAVAQAVTQAMRTINNSGSGPTPSGGTSSDGNPSGGNGGDRGTQDWKLDEVDFFDSEYEDANNAFIVNAGRHVFYRNVYAFIDRLKDVVFLRGEDKLRIMIFQCLRGFALIWHSMELFDVEKLLLRDAFVNFWAIVLIIRFKKRTSMTLLRFQRKRYIMTHAREQKNSRLFVQDIFRHVKAAEMSFIHNQLTMAWNNMDWEFRRDIPEPTSDINIRKFLEQLDFKSSIWFDMARRTEGQASSQRSNSNSKSNRRGRTDGFNQSLYDNVVFSSQYSSRSQGWIFYQFQSSVYQYRQYFNSEQQGRSV